MILNGTMLNRTRARTTPSGGATRTVAQHTVSVTGPTGNRSVPLALLGVTDRAALEPLATILAGEGMGLAVALGERACLRVACAVRPDIILLDPRLPRALLSLLRGHPLSRSAHIGWSHALGARSRSLSDIHPK